MLSIKLQFHLEELTSSTGPRQMGPPRGEQAGLFERGETYADKPAQSSFSTAA